EPVEDLDHHLPVGRDEPDRPHVGDAAVEGRIPRLVGNPGVRPRLDVALRPNPDLQLASAREVGNDEATLGIGLDGADARTGSDLHLRTFDGLHLVGFDPTDHAAARGRGQDLHLVVVTFRFVLGACDQESEDRPGDDGVSLQRFHSTSTSSVAVIDPCRSVPLVSNKGSRSMKTWTLVPTGMSTGAPKTAIMPKESPSPTIAMMAVSLPSSQGASPTSPLPSRSRSNWTPTAQGASAQ